MAISGTYLQLQQQIADELGDRQDLLVPLADSALTLSPIKNAIASAIAKWEREPFYFTENYSQNLFNTVAGQEFYTTAAATMIATSPNILKLHIFINANRYPLQIRTWQYLEDTSVNPAVQGQPIDYAYFAEQLRFYPIPMGAYPITISGIGRLAALSADSDANTWTQDGYDLIRSEAKLILAEETLMDDDLAGRCRAAIYGNPQNPVERGYLAALKGETARRARAKIRPSHFAWLLVVSGLSQLSCHLS
jgi:hypothetical protein